MSERQYRLTQAALDVVGAVLKGKHGGSGLSSLLSTDDHVATAANASFKASGIFKMAVLGSLLARLKRVPVSQADARCAERVLAVIEELENATELKIPAAGLGVYAADSLIGATLRNERAAEHELEVLLGPQPMGVRTMLEAARAALVLDEVMLAFVALRELGHSVKLTEIFAALGTVVDREVAYLSGQSRSRRGRAVA